MDKNIFDVKLSAKEEEYMKVSSGDSGGLLQTSLLKKTYLYRTIYYNIIFIKIATSCFNHIRRGSDIMSFYNRHEEVRRQEAV